MSIKDNCIVDDVQTIYEDGAEGNLWELIMGRHIHIGGFHSSMDLAIKAGITPQMSGLDLCTNNGEAMRFLVRHRGVRHMHGVELTATSVARGRKRTAEEGFGDAISFDQGDVTTGLPKLADNSVDFVWGEDAWCYIPDKSALVGTAVRLVKPGGAIAFTDWIKGPNHSKMTKDEYARYLHIMTFPNVETVEGYDALLKRYGCEVVVAEDSQRFAPCMQLYMDMFERQLKGDALRMLGHDTNAYEKVLRDFRFMLGLAKEGKVSQGMFVGRKKGGQPKAKL